MELLGGAGLNEMKSIQAWFDLIPYLPNDQKIESQAIAKVKNVAKHFPILAGELGIHLYTPDYNGMFNSD